MVDKKEFHHLETIVILEGNKLSGIVSGVKATEAWPICLTFSHLTTCVDAIRKQPHVLDWYSQLYSRPVKSESLRESFETPLVGPDVECGRHDNSPHSHCINMNYELEILCLF